VGLKLLRIYWAQSWLDCGVNWKSLKQQKWKSNGVPSTERTCQPGCLTCLVLGGLLCIICRSLLCIKCYGIPCLLRPFCSPVLQMSALWSPFCCSFSYMCRTPQPCLLDFSISCTLYLVLSAWWLGHLPLSSFTPTSNSLLYLCGGLRRSACSCSLDYIVGGWVERIKCFPGEICF
jgi:hypothetical protein